MGQGKDSLRPQSLTAGEPVAGVSSARTPEGHQVKQRLSAGQNVAQGCQVWGQGKAGVELSLWGREGPQIPSCFQNTR